MPALRRRRALKSAVAVLALVALVTAVWGIKQWAPFADDESSTIYWPRSIKPLADFVEDTTGLQFDQSVEVQFAGTDEEYAAIADPPRPQPTADELEIDAAQEAAGRAFGLWNGEMSSADADAAIYANIGVASWDPFSNVLVVRADDPEDLSPRVRSSVVRELTFALDAQRFDYVSRVDDLRTRQEYLALIALDVGHALWVHDRYFSDELTLDEQEDYGGEIVAGNEDYTDTTDWIPPAYAALRTIAQQLGIVFVDVLSDDPAALHRALGDELPQALDQITLPVGHYQRLDRTEAVEAPPVPRGGERLYTNQAGPFLLHLMLSTGSPANTALTAADGWGGDAYTVYRLNDRVCLDMHMVADSRADADRLDIALNNWAAVRPAASSALVGRDGVDLYVSVCDPGTAEEQPVPTQDDVDQYVRRSNLLRHEMTITGDLEAAECTAVAVFADALVADFDDPNFDIVGVITAAEADCGIAQG